MNEEKPIWKGKGPIMYNVSINDGVDLGANEAEWKYHLYISGAGKYENAYLGNIESDVGFFADTQDGVMRDLAKYLTQIQPSNSLSKTDREAMNLPPQNLDLDNVVIFDYTKNKDFHGVNFPAFFANADGVADSPLPQGEHPFIVSIDGPEAEGYTIQVNEMDPVVIEELEYWSAYSSDIDDFHYDVPAQDVIKTIKSSLSGRSIEYPNKITPNINNTKILNNTDNPNFTLNSIFGTPLQITRRPPSLQLPKKVPTAKVEMPRVEPVLAKKENVDLEIAKKEAEKLKRLRA